MHEDSCVAGEMMFYNYNSQAMRKKRQDYKFFFAARSFVVIDSFLSVKTMLAALLGKRERQ